MSIEDSKKDLVDTIKVQILSSVASLLSATEDAINVLRENLNNDSRTADAREDTAMKILNKIFADRTDDGVISVASFNVEQLNKLIEQIESEM